MAASRFVLLFGLWATASVLICPVPCAAQSATKPSFTPEQEQARQAVLTSAAWKAEVEKFHQWLAVQTAYTAEQVAEMKKQLAARIDAMSADELQTFLVTMQQRLDVLLSPEFTAARQWADEFYTPKGKQELAAKYGLSDPIHLSAEQLSEAMARFAEDRKSHASAQAAFQEQQAAQIAGLDEYRQAQQRAAEQAAAAARRPASFGTPYAPTRPSGPQRYQAPYDPMHFSVGPWGGVWIGF